MFDVNDLGNNCLYYLSKVKEFATNFRKSNKKILNSRVIKNAFYKVKVITIGVFVGTARTVISFPRKFHAFTYLDCKNTRVSLALFKYETRNSNSNAYKVENK